MSRSAILALTPLQFLAQIAPLPDDADVQRLRELSVDYIREAERIEKEGVTTVESSEQISAGLDAIARNMARPRSLKYSLSLLFTVPMDRGGA
jgi:hypothetical protein